MLACAHSLERGRTVSQSDSRSNQCGHKKLTTVPRERQAEHRASLSHPRVLRAVVYVYIVFAALKPPLVDPERDRIRMRASPKSCATHRPPSWSHGTPRSSRHARTAVKESRHRARSSAKPRASGDAAADPAHSLTRAEPERRIQEILPVLQVTCPAKTVMSDEPLEGQGAEADTKRAKECFRARSARIKGGLGGTSVREPRAAAHGGET